MNGEAERATRFGSVPTTIPWSLSRTASRPPLSPRFEAWQRMVQRRRVAERGGGEAEQRAAEDLAPTASQVFNFNDPSEAEDGGVSWTVPWR